MVSHRLLALAAGLAFAMACSGRDEAAPAASTLDAAHDDTGVVGNDAAAMAHDADLVPSAEGGLRADGSAQGEPDAQTAVDAAAEAGAVANQCPGTTPAIFPAQAGRCRTGADCRGFERCGLNYESAGCGACFRSERACEDGGCASGLVCVERVPPCSCTGQPSTACEPRCTASSCAGDEACGADGRCAPRSCKQGYACTSQQVCAPDRMLADVHGCAVAHCDSDRVGCPAGFRCETTLPAPSSNGCVPIHCNAGFTCAPNRVCSPTSSQPHGCELKTCARDQDCGCGVCIGDSCRDELLVCSPPPAP